MYENGDDLRHYDTAQHKYFKIHVLACKDWNVTKNLTTHRTLAWQHIYTYNMILLALNWKWLFIGWITLFCVDNILPSVLGNFLPIHVTAISLQTN